MSSKRPKTNKSTAKMASSDERDELRMRRSGAEESGYHSPTQQDIEDLRKDHSTSSQSGVINADESVRRESDDTPGPINSLSGEIEEQPEEERREPRTA